MDREALDREVVEYGFVCSRCKKPRDRHPDRYCRECKNAYMREWRKTHPLNEIQRLKANVRRKTGMRITRGSLIRQPCEVCGEKKVQAHHKHYYRPYDVNWLCAPCHRKTHREMDKCHR